METIRQHPAALRIFTDGRRYTARGTFCERGGKYTLDYADPEMDGTPTTLTFDQTELLLVRSGSYRTTLRFRSGWTEAVEYQTPYGALTMSVTTVHLQIHGLLSGWQIDLSYELGFGDGPVEPHEMSILITA